LSHISTIFTADEKTTSLLIFERQLGPLEPQSTKSQLLYSSSKPADKVIIFLQNDWAYWFLHHQIPFVHWIQFKQGWKTERFKTKPSWRENYCFFKAQVITPAFSIDLTFICSNYCIQKNNFRIDLKQKYKNITTFYHNIPLCW
jgi:hypothetical protein